MSTGRTLKFSVVIGLAIAALVVSAGAANAANRQVGAPIVGEEFREQLGITVAISADGTRIAATSVGEDSPRESTRLFRVYELQDAQWTQLGEAIELDADGRSMIPESIELNSDGSRLVIGLPGFFGGFEAQVHVFEFTNGEWAQLGSTLFDEVTGPTGSDFGQSVDISPDGDHLAVGAPRFTNFNDPDGGGNHGFVRIFTFQAGDWVQIGSDVIGNSVTGQFGDSIAISADGSRFAAGAPAADDAATNAGQAEVFELVDGDWAPVGDPIDGTQVADFLGFAIEMSNDGQRVVVNGARSVDDPQRAYVRVFDEVGGQWVQVGDDLLGEPRVDQGFTDRFGFSYSLSNDGQRLAVSALDGGDDRAGGQVTVFEFGDRGWQAAAVFNGSLRTNNFGIGVDLSGDGSRVVISEGGFSIDTPTGSEPSVGRVRVYALDEPGPICGGLPATLIGTAGDDELIGTPGPDVILGLQGNDIIRSLGGDDIVCAGQGDDTIFGGEGFDIIFGAQGNDTIFSANGFLDAERLDIRGARMFGGAGDDLIYGSTRWDRMQGGPGDDQLFGYEGRDWIRGGPGADAIDGGTNICLLYTSPSPRDS